MRRCNVNFQSNYATIEGIGHVCISDYINGKYNPTTTKPFCIPLNHELVVVNSTHRRPHFRHKHNSDMEGTPMTAWHAEWQGNFPVTEVSFKNRSGQIKDRRADVVISSLKRIVELQHSQIERDEVRNRNDDYGLHDHEIIWIIHSQGSIVTKNIGDRIILEFVSNLWLYNSFIDCKTVYYDIDGFIYMLNPNNVRANQIDVSEPKVKSDFIDALNTQSTLWITSEPPQAYLFVKQQGAGSGKTYGMMQSLNNDPEIANYQWIILITKQHSAVNVMYTEFMNQHKEGVLTNIELIGEPLLENKKYIIHYRHKLTNVEACVVFATVDSFTYAVGEASANSSDTFASIVRSIKDGISKVKRSGALRFAGVDPYINKETIIMIDETQDLSELYGEAFLKFVSSTHTNMCVVGDRLQSLSHRNNALTFLHHAESARLKVIKGDATNVVRRFSNPALVKFVNSMIPYEEYDIPPMTPAEIEDETPGALNIFSAKTVYADESTEDASVLSSVAQIMSYFKYEVESMSRVPEDFLFVTPFTSKNPLVEALQIAVNIYWKDTMENNKQYIENVKSVHSYWKNVNPTEYTRFAIFHKSQDMGSINLADSKHATRMVSIHSSKGDGRKVVFVIGVSQSALQQFSQVANNIIYESLLHVAITRQKERLYFRLDKNEDDIYKRIFRSTAGVPIDSMNEFEFVKPSIQLSRISDSILNFSFNEVFENIICKKEPPKLPPVSEEKLLIDMGDHNIRYAAMFMNVIVHICNHEQRTGHSVKHQMYAILGSIKPENIKIVSELREYINLLKDNDKHDGKMMRNIPLLQFTRCTDGDYTRYFNIIVNIMFRIIEEIKYVGVRQLNYFCPLESIILYYMIECIEKGVYQSITINDVYNIIDTYSRVFESSAKGHEHCRCNEHFASDKRKVISLTTNQLKQQEYLRNHYDRLTHICSILDRFVEDNPSISWLYQHALKYSGVDINEFSISTGIPLIGYDKGRIYIINILPQFNDLNFYKMMIDSICHTWAIQNVDMASENYKKFKGKQIMSCVLSLNRTDMYVVDWTMPVIDNRDFITYVIYDTLYNELSAKHEQYYNTFISIGAAHDWNSKKIIEQCNKAVNVKGRPVAKYITKFCICLEGKLNDCCGKKEKQEILEQYANKDTFVKMMNRYLERSLLGFLGMVEEDEE